MRARRQVLGEGMAPHLGTVAAALPAVWSRVAPGQAAPSAPGTETRLHGALIAVLTHLLRRLPAAAMARPPQRPCLASSMVGACGLVLAEAEHAPGHNSAALLHRARRRHGTRRGITAGLHAQEIGGSWEC